MSKWIRKIQKTGPGTLGLNLPASWIRDHSIGPGEEVKLEERDKKIIISGGGIKDGE